MNRKPIYKTWIRVKKLIVFILITLLLLITTLLPINFYLRILAGILSIPFLYISFLLSYSYYQFASWGGDFQRKIHNLIVYNISKGENSKILDIGTGNASLIIKLAKGFPKSKLVGIDFWGEDWEYSKKICEVNAEIEGVANRIQFIKASASKIPFQNNEFDIIVSCLTFHEVKDERNKIKVLTEALRVLKEDGEFVFLDLFSDDKAFGQYDELLNSIRALGIKELTAEKLENIIALPNILSHKKILGNAVVLRGRK